MGQGDVHPLHGPAGARAATWFDSQNEVCWFLGFSPAHDYGLFEARAEARELLPSEDDETLLELEQEEHDFELRLGPGLVKLVDTAIKSPGNPARGTVGALMRVEVSAIAIEVYGTIDMICLTIPGMPA